MKSYLQSKMKFYLHKGINLMILSFVLLLSAKSSQAQTIPADLMRNCSQWKITYPTGVEDKTLCDEPNNEFFHVNENGDAIAFDTPIRSDNGTTPNSSNIRSELRERVQDGSVDIYWTTEGTHMLYIKQAITHLPINKPQLVATQIHGNKDDGIDDAMVMRLENSHLFLSFNGGKLRSDVTIKNDYILGTVQEVIFLVKDNKHYCYYSEDGNLLDAYNNGTASSYLVKDGDNDYVMDLAYDQSYFKVGNYTQSNADEEGEDTDDPNNYGEVLVYDFLVDHGQVDVTGVSLSENILTLVENDTKQLAPTVAPLTATNIGVSYSSNNPTVASVDETTGVVTALSEGVATITVTTDEGNFTDDCEITIVPQSVGENLALNKAITESGSHDADYIPANLVDGSTSTKWSASGFPQTAIIDLGALYNIGRTELVCHQGRDYQFIISVSNTIDGDYTTVVDRSNNMTPGTIDNPIIDVFSGVEGQFVKITILGAATYTGSWMSLVELRVFAAPENTTTGIFETSKNKDVVLWPNPANNTVNIQGINDYQTLTIYDQLGKIISKQTVKNNSINISSLQSGMYIFKFEGKDKIVSKYLIKR